MGAAYIPLSATQRRSLSTSGDGAQAGDTQLRAVGLREETSWVCVGAEEAEVDALASGVLPAG
jgi:hypothetical protein